MTFYQFFQEKIKNQSILILGLGKEGRSSLNLILKTGGFFKLGIADEKEQNLNFLHEYYEAEDASDNRKADRSNRIQTHFGPNYQDSNNHYDLIFKSPGVVLSGNTDLHKITGAMQLFTEYYKEQIIGITGTKGKSTTASLIAHVLKENGVDTVLAGNIGIPVFDILDEITKDTAIVLEMSCHQLEYMKVSPKIGILLNLHQEHLDHYGSYEAYCQAKFNIFKHMTRDSLFIGSKKLTEETTLPEGIETEFISYEDEKTTANILVNERGFSYKDVFYPVHPDIPLPGIHNIYNLSAVYAVVKRFGVSFSDFIKSIYSFRPLPHRLERIGSFHGIDFYDDSISTMGSSTISAVRAVKNTGSVLIGGMDRGIDYSDLADFILEHPEYCFILMEATGKRIYTSLKQRNPSLPNVMIVEHLEDAVEAAFHHTEKGKACILSPAAASYGIFRNFEHRGEVFQELVRSYQDASLI